LLGHGYMRRGRTQGDTQYERAAEYFKQLRDYYPNSVHVVEAMRLEMICREKSGLGADYDMRQIDEAGKLAKMIRLQQGSRMTSDQWNELLEADNRLNEQQAEKLWVNGKFYDDRKEYGAAKMQYMQILDRYPATKYADMARTRYDRIRDFPDEPPTDWERIKSAVTLGRK